MLLSMIGFSLMRTMCTAALVWNMEANKVITVFYDGQCGLCSKEINHYRRISPEGIFEWQDITITAKGLEKEGITLSQGLRFLHVKDAEGNMHVGVDGFVVIWRQLPRWRVLAALVSLPLVRPLAAVVYRLFANWRFKRLSHCQLAAKKDEEF